MPLAWVPLAVHCGAQFRVGIDLGTLAQQLGQHFDDRNAAACDAGGGVLLLWDH